MNQELKNEMKEFQRYQDVRITDLQREMCNSTSKYDEICTAMKEELIAVKRQNKELCGIIAILQDEILDIKNGTSIDSSRGSSGKIEQSMNARDEVSVPMIEPKHREDLEQYLKSNRLCMIDLCNYYNIQQELEGCVQPIVCSKHHTHCHSASVKLRHPFGYSKFAALYQASRSAHLFSGPRVVRRLFEAILNDNGMFSESAPPCE